MRSHYSVYKSLFMQFHCWRHALLCMLVNGLSALTEGLALSALLPLINSLTGTPGWPPLQQALRIIGLPAMDDTVFFLCIFGLLGIFSAALSLYAKKLILELRAHVEHQIRTHVSRALLGMEWSAFLSMRLGDISKAVLFDGVLLGSGAAALSLGLGMALAAMCYFLVGLVISPQLSCLTFIFGLIAYATYALGGRMASKPANALPGFLNDMSILTNEVFGNLKFFRASGLSGAAGNDLDQSFSNNARALYKSQVCGHIMRFVLELEGLLFIALLLYLCVGQSTIPLGTVMVFLALFFRMAPRLFASHESLFQAQTLAGWYDLWHQRLTFAKEHPLPPEGLQAPIFTQRLELCNVRYAYPESQLPALEGVNLRLNVGDCLAIVGPSGSGKSTLTDLISCLLTPQEGSILIDGTPLQNTNLSSWRASIGLVLQDTPILYGRIFENIACGDPTPDRARAEAAAKRADAWDFIEAAGGLDAPVGEKGGKLSGGQRQRLALARTLYRSPKLLVLDEPTSALDSASEERILVALRSLKGSCSMLFISHRLNPVRIADWIVVMVEGRIMEQGTWEELISKTNGYFAEMARQQNLAP